jgi:hypothetical protein
MHALRAMFAPRCHTPGHCVRHTTCDHSTKQHHHNHNLYHHRHHHHHHLPQAALAKEQKLREVAEARIVGLEAELAALKA